MTCQDLYDTQGGAAQTIGIGGRLWGEADAEQPNQAVETVEKREERPGLRNRQGVVGETRQPMLINGVSDRGGFTGKAGVFTPHSPLKRGHFDHHTGGEIGLQDLRGTRSDLDIGAPKPDGFRKRLDAFLPGGSCRALSRVFRGR